MPNRIIKESICTSEEIDSLTPEQEVFFYRLIVACDDYGLMDARPAILKARCYPLKSIEINCIQEMLDAISSAGLVQQYQIDGRCYIHVINWEKHQSIRAKKPKYPSPKSSDFICKQTQANVPVIQSNPIQSESKSTRDVEEIVLPDWMPLDAWNAWVAMRVSIKKPLTPRATTRAINKLTAFKEKGYDIEAVLDQAENGQWTDLYEPKEKAKEEFDPAEIITMDNGSQMTRAALEMIRRFQ